MAKKSSPKNVIDYDPLAWFDESDNTMHESSSSSTSDKQSMTTQEDEEENSAYGFFTSDSDTQDKSVESEMYVSEDNTEAFGFFDDATDKVVISTAQQDEVDNIIQLGSELTIKSVASCKALVDKTISNGFDVKISAGELQKIDTAGLQLLYSLNKTLEKSAQVIHWESTNPIINQAAHIIGMQDIVEDPLESSAYGFFADENYVSDISAQQEPGFGFF